MHASQIVDDQLLKSPCVDVRADPLNRYSFICLFITLFYFLLPKAERLFLLVHQPPRESERTPSNDVMLTLPNEIKEKKYMKSKGKEKINKEEIKITASVGSEEKKVENLGTRLRRWQQSFSN